MATLADMVSTLNIVLSLVFFVWLFGWAKGALGSAKLAAIFAAIVTFLTVIKYPELLWVGIVLFLFATFGKELFSKMART